VFVKVDRPLPGLAEQVREIVPNAVDIVIDRSDIAPEESGPVLEGMSAEAMFTAYYEGTFGSAPRTELLELFNRLYEETAGAPD
jgi:hypothetical protein